VPRNRHDRKRHLESVHQLLQLINEVLTMAPEYNEDAMVILPLGAILDWTMGTPADFAACQVDPSDEPCRSRAEPDEAG
jgi:phosphatidylserine decarboxylase